MQSSLHCCGVNNYTDWLLLPSPTVPASCLKNITNILDSDSQEDEEKIFFSNGCYGIVKKKLDTDMIIINCRFIIFDNENHDKIMFKHAVSASYSWN